jgi:ankyrin repeat protein
LTQLLLDKGANCNAKDYSGRTPLHVAAVNGKEECVRLLLGSGADVEAKNVNGQTALQLAAAHQQTVIMTLLILGHSS